MELNIIKISQVGSKYVVESSIGKINILNLKSLKWNLKNVFGMSGQDVLIIVVLLGDGQNNTVELEVAA